MKIQNKTEIDLSEEDVKNILYEHLRKGYGDGEYSFRFKVVNKPIKSGIYDSMDHYVFDGVTIVISKDDAVGHPFPKKVIKGLLDRYNNE